MELFETTGTVELAEILFEGTRSKGCGVVQFAQVQEAEVAIGESNYDSRLAKSNVLQLNSQTMCTVADPLVCRFA